MRWRLLLPILILGILLRLYSLANLPAGLHWDEMDTGYQAWSLLQTGKDYFGNVMPVFPHSLADWRTPVFIYSTVPFVAAFDMTAMGVRLPAAIFGILSIILIWIFAGRLFNRRIGLLAGLSMAVSIWAVQYSRQSVETISLMAYTLVAANLFFRGLKKPKWLVVSGLFFALATACYAPGKLFIPLFILGLIVIHFRKLIRLPKKYLLWTVIILGLICTPVYWLSLIGPAGARFHEIAIVTDPTLATTIDNQRLMSVVASGKAKTPGLQPRLIDKVLFNKPLNIGTTFVNNYLAAFSTDFLFTKGDQELRHSPSKNTIGMLLLADTVFLLLGVFVVRKPEVWLWLLLGPVAAALTRDGGAHAARSLIMLPALTFFIAAGAEKLYLSHKKIFWLYSLVILFNLVLVYGYYFNTYRSESAQPFMWGEDQLVTLVKTQAPKYDRVIVDLKSESLLMAYLFYGHVRPTQLHNVTLFGSVDTVAFGNIYLANAGVRTWVEILASPEYTGHNFIIADFRGDKLDKVKNKQEIDYPDTTPAFYTFAQ